jgi:hypothetical protein
VRFARQRKKRVLCAVMRVDLNPARAAMCKTLAESDYTTIQRWLREPEGLTKKIKPGRSILGRLLKPVAGLNADALMAMSESSYIELVQWTGEQARPDKRGKLRPLTNGKHAAPADIWQIANHPRECIRQVQGTEKPLLPHIGSAEALMAKAEELGQVWMKGVASELARKILRERPT